MLRNNFEFGILKKWLELTSTRKVLRDLAEKASLVEEELLTVGRWLLSAYEASAPLHPQKQGS